MSKYMLSDENANDNVNPFVLIDFSLPGERLSPHTFSKDKLVPQKVDTPTEMTSPICDYGISAGNKTIDMCRPQKPNCPLKRPLYPMRNLDLGFTPEVNRSVRPVKIIKDTKQNSVFIGAFFIFLLLILILLMK